MVDSIFSVRVPPSVMPVRQESLWGGQIERVCTRCAAGWTQTTALEFRQPQNSQRSAVPCYHWLIALRNTPRNSTQHSTKKTPHHPTPKNSKTPHQRNGRSLGRADAFSLKNPCYTESSQNARKQATKNSTAPSVVRHERERMLVLPQVVPRRSQRAGRRQLRRATAPAAPSRGAPYRAPRGGGTGRSRLRVRATGIRRRRRRNPPAPGPGN